MSHLFTSDDQKTGASASVLPVDIQGDWSPCSPRDFEESSPAPQFQGIHSLVFYLFYGPALTTVRDHWENHSLDYAGLCQQSMILYDLGQVLKLSSKLGGLEWIGDT